jgi:hypothetical protein
MYSTFLHYVNTASPGLRGSDALGHYYKDPLLVNSRLRLTRRRPIPRKHHVNYDLASLARQLPYLSQATPQLRKRGEIAHVW